MAGGIHHVWQRGNNRQLIFREAWDHRFFLSLLREETDRHHWHCLGYCLMPNHFHLVLETPECTLGSGMRDLNGRYAQWFNDRHETGGGHLFQARFGSKPVLRAEQFAQLLRYVARNPLRAGLCDDPEAWPWSNHRALMRGTRDPLIAVDRVAARLGGPDSGFSAYRRVFDRDGPLAGIDPDLSPWEIRPTLAELVLDGRNMAQLRAAREEGYRLAEIARHIGVSEATVCRRLARAAEPRA